MTKTKRTFIWTLAIATFQVLVLAELALARADRDVSYSEYRYEMSWIEKVYVRGTLACVEETSIEAGDCKIALAEDDSSDVFRLRNATHAMKLFREGKKRVIVKGILESDDSITIRSVYARN